MSPKAEPYSPEHDGGLEEYLRERELDQYVTNWFEGPQYFFEIRDKGLLQPPVTTVRVCRESTPDWVYFVNHDHKLESNGPEEQRMSCVAAPEGVYDPRDRLEDKLWSISGLELWDE